MFTIIGADGKEYGPVSADKLREWIASGRANAQTQARREGETAWSTLGSLPEFAGAFAAQPPPVGTPPDRTWNVLVHLSALCGYIIPLGHVLGPLLVWQLKKDTAPDVIPHGKEAVNFQLSCLLWAVIAGLLVFAVIGIPLLVAVGLMNVICVVIAAIKANNGTVWRYPLTIRFIS